MLNETIKNKMKIALKKTLSIQTIIFILAVTGSLFYYGKSFYKNKQLIFDIDDIKIVLGLTIMLVWIMVFAIYLMIELNKKDKIIIKQNNHIQQQNDVIQNLLNEMIVKNDENTEGIIEQNEENFDQLIKSERNTKALIIDINDRNKQGNRGDDIA
ncbi:hypothetical protein ACFHWD_04195 [Clostridium sp. MT-14]|uniref:hypothetical protein n=1 Tax=Clostridium sp. MT-14 TaxID=3348360 RepID=UPI0035F4A6AF